MPVVGDHLLQLFGAVQFVQRRNGLQPNVVHAPEHRREYGKPHEDHHPLEVDGVAHVRRAAGHLPRRVEDGRRRFIQRVIFFQLAAMREMRLKFLNQVL